MDIFIEYMVKHKFEGKNYAIISGLVLLALVLTVVILFFRTYLMGLWLLLIAFVWFGAVVFIRQQILEYEYIVTNNEMDIDQIMAKNGRKRILTVDFKQMSILAAVDDADFKAEYERPGERKVIEAIGNRADGGLYFLDTTVNLKGSDTAVRLIFQPNQSILEAAWKFNPRNTHIKK